MSNELWPRRVHLAVQGFDHGGHLKIARGSDWELLVKADAALGREIPEAVQVRYSTPEAAEFLADIEKDLKPIPRAERLTRIALNSSTGQPRDVNLS